MRNIDSLPMTNCEILLWRCDKIEVKKLNISFIKKKTQQQIFVLEQRHTFKKSLVSLWIQAWMYCVLKCSMYMPLSIMVYPCQYTTNNMCVALLLTCLRLFIHKSTEFFVINDIVTANSFILARTILFNSQTNETFRYSCILFVDSMTKISFSPVICYWFSSRRKKSSCLLRCVCFGVSFAWWMNQLVEFWLIAGILS